MGTRNGWKQFNILISPEVRDWIDETRGDVSVQNFAFRILEERMKQHRGQQQATPTEEAAPPKEEVLDLMAALKASLKASQEPGR